MKWFPLKMSVLSLVLALGWTVTGCAESIEEQNAGVDEYGVAVGDVDEDGKRVLGTTGWEEPSGKADAIRGRAGLPVSVDNQSTAVWEVKNAWADKDTPAARKAGMAWGENSGLNWEQKFQRWVESLPRVDRESHGETFMLKTPYGVELPGPALECAEVAMFLRIAFASWYGLPFFTEGRDNAGNRLYFGHFGIRTANGRFGNMPNFKTQYRDESHLAHAFERGEVAWPSDANLAKRKIPGAMDDAQPMIGPDAHGGAYFDRVFLNKRVGYFLLMQLTYFGSVNLADPVNTFHIKPEALTAGDTLLHRWQRTGIGHVMVVMRVRKAADREVNGEFVPQIEAEIASGSMPRRQPLWESAAASKRSFTSNNAGGGDYVDFNGGVKRWRAATNINGSWTNVVPEVFINDYITSTDKTKLAERPQRFADILTELDPAELLGALAEIVEAQRAHLRNYPASCAARIRREDAFDDLYAVGADLGKDRKTIDREYRTLEDYVLARLVYGASKTCCWNSTSRAMFDLIMEFNAAHIEDAAAGVCNEPIVFKGRNDGSDGFEIFREYARSQGKEDLWVRWSADETCPQAGVAEDTEDTHSWTPWCEAGLGAGTVPGPVTPGDVVSFTNNDRVAIPDNDPAGIKSVIDVDAQGTVRGVTVDVDISHTWRGDLTIELRKGNNKALVHRGQGRDNDIQLTSEIVDGFDGVAAAGAWELIVVDSAAQDVGTLNSWTLYLELD